MRLHLKITPKLTLVFVLSATALLVGVSLLAYYSGRSALQAAITSDLVSTAIEKEAALNAWIKERQSNIAMLANLHHLQETVSVLTGALPNSNAARAAHDHLVENLNTWVGEGRPFVDLLVIDGKSGRVIASTNPNEEGKFREDRPYFINGKKGPYTQNPYYDISLQAPAMTAAAPIVSAGGRLLAVIAGHLKMIELNEIIPRRTGLHKTDDAFLVNTSHLFITQPRFVSDPAVLWRSIYTEDIKRGLAGNSGVVSTDDYRGVPVISVYRWLPECQLCQIVKIDQAEAFAPSHSFGKTLAIIGCLVLLMASTLAFGLGCTITRPILALQTGVERFGKGDLDIRLPETSKDEIGLLAKEFNTMAANLAEKETKLRSYTEQLEQMVQERTEALRLSEERFRIAAESASDLIWERDIVKGRLAWFGNIDEILGYGPGEFPRTIEAWEKIIHPDDHDRVMTSLDQHLQTRKPYLEEYRIFKKDGSILYWLDSGTGLWDEEGKAYKMIGAVSDITERKQAEEEIRQLNANLEQRVIERTAQLEAANKELEAFSYSVSHDLRAPLRAIDGFSGIVLEDYSEKLDEEGKRFLNIICDNTQKMGQLIDDLLAFSRIGRQEIKIAEVEMDKLAKSVFEELKTTVSDRTFNLNIKPFPPAYVDRAMIRQVFANLLSNAVKFTRPKERAVIEVDGRSEGDENIYLIRDNGVGFDMQYVNKLFGVFQRLHSAEEFEGTGVGLAIVQRIIHRHGGRVWAEGKMGEGATFYFTLPKKMKNEG